MQKRLFLAISLPEDVKKRLFRFVEKEYRNLPVKWVQRENLHITLIFLGYTPEEKIPEICEAIGEKLAGVSSFELEFQNFQVGPNKEAKKMIWAAGEKSGELAELKYRLDKALGAYIPEKKEFRPHITLGRIIKREWGKISPEPEVEKKFTFSVPVGSVELFESKFEKGKRVYYVLESFSLR